MQLRQDGMNEWFAVAETILHGASVDSIVCNYRDVHHDRTSRDGDAYMFRGNRTARHLHNAVRNPGNEQAANRRNCGKNGEVHVAHQ